MLQKEEATIPVTTLSPPEGNTTFLGGTTWCVALPGVSQVDLQNALDWACGLGNTNCGPIQSDGDCFQPDTLLSHASYAFNSYYQQNGNSDIACNFGGTATLTKSNPSKFFDFNTYRCHVIYTLLLFLLIRVPCIWVTGYAKCVYTVSGYVFLVIKGWEDRFFSEYVCTRAYLCVYIFFLFFNFLFYFFNFQIRSIFSSSNFKV